MRQASTLPACAVCISASSGKYKCPTCRAPYCSVACFKQHKASPCAPPPPPPAPGAAWRSLRAPRRGKTGRQRKATLMRGLFFASSSAPAAAAARVRGGRGGRGRPAAEAGRPAAPGCAAAAAGLQTPCLRLTRCALVCVPAADAGVLSALRDADLRRAVRHVDRAEDGEAVRVPRRPHAPLPRSHAPRCATLTPHAHAPLQRPQALVTALEDPRFHAFADRVLSVLRGDES